MPNTNVVNRNLLVEYLENLNRSLHLEVPQLLPNRQLKEFYEAALRDIDKSEIIVKAQTKLHIEDEDVDRDLDSDLQFYGLAGPQLEFKMSIFDHLKLGIGNIKNLSSLSTKKIKDWLDLMAVLIGSLVKVFPFLEPLLELLNFLKAVVKAISPAKK